MILFTGGVWSQGGVWSRGVCVWSWGVPPILGEGGVWSREGSSKFSGGCLKFLGGCLQIFGGLQFFGGCLQIFRGCSSKFSGGVPPNFRGGSSKFLGVLQIFGGGLHRNTVNVRPVRILLESILVYLENNSVQLFRMAKGDYDVSCRIESKMLGKFSVRIFFHSLTFENSQVL